MKQLCFLLLLVLSGVHLTRAQTPANGPGQAGPSLHLPETVAPPNLKLPAEVRLILEVTELPGIANPKSFWEGDYEIRIADWSAVVAQTKTGSKEVIGDLLLRSYFGRQLLREKEQRRVALSMPVTGTLRSRLLHQDQFPQAFVLRSTLRVFDAQLGQNYAFPLNRVWQAELFPDGRASITIKLAADGSYGTWGPLPQALPAGYTLIGTPAKNSPAQQP